VDFLLGIRKCSQGLRALDARAPRLLGRPNSHCVLICPPTRARTWDLILKRDLLYQLSYERKCARVAVCATYHVGNEAEKWFPFAVNDLRKIV
jgi:hypothetical protein